MTAVTCAPAAAPAFLTSALHSPGESRRRCGCAVSEGAEVSLRGGSSARVHSDGPVTGTVAGSTLDDLPGTGTCAGVAADGASTVRCPAPQALASPPHETRLEIGRSGR